MSTPPLGSSPTVESHHARAEHLYQAGMVAYQDGNPTQAHLLWQQAVHLHPRYLAVWLALYQVVKSDADRIICLENALRLGAKNPRIPQRLQDLRRRQRIMAGIPAEPIPARNHRLKWGLMMIVVIVLVMIALWVVGGSALGSL